MMAEQLILIHVVSQRRIAAWTSGNPATITAEDVRSGTAAVEEQDGLLALFQGLDKCLLQGTAENRAVACFELLAHVDRSYGWQVDVFCVTACGPVLGLQTQSIGLLG